MRFSAIPWYFSYLQISLQHLQKLVSIDSPHDLMLDPHIKDKPLKPSNFYKMDVRGVHALLTDAVDFAIRYLV